MPGCEMTSRVICEFDSHVVIVNADICMVEILRITYAVNIF